jgi:hypothetical protein
MIRRLCSSGRCLPVTQPWLHHQRFNDMSVCFMVQLLRLLEAFGEKEEPGPQFNATFVAKPVKKMKTKLTLKR